MIDKFNIKDFPDLAGVYLMKNKDKKIIYIGKAKNLKKRVSSYFNRIHSDEKTKELVKKIESIDYIICNSEIDALILENNLIKKNKPKYNISLKDEKTYPYIKITQETFPKLSVIRTTKYLDDKQAIYFGPYPYNIYYFIKILKKIFPIRDCNRDMSKAYSRPCLKYHMKTCLGPCVYKNIEIEYKENVRKIIDFLKGDIKEIIKKYKHQMLQASEEMDFEKAILFREKINNIEKIAINQISELGKAVDEDVFVMKVEGEKLFVCVLTIREGKIIGKQSTNQNISNFIIEDLFLQVLTLYYMKHPLPNNLILENKYADYQMHIKEWALLYKKVNISIFYPKIKSRKMELLDMSLINLEKDMENYYNSKRVVEEALINLFSTLKLKTYPKRIECFDISNTQGTNPVASMSVAIDGKKANKEYRKFKIMSKSSPDDFQMMREVVQRRYSKLDIKELPNLILIDGGKGQLNTVAEILYGLDLLDKIDLISIAKKEEEIFKLGENEAYIFSKKDESLKILQRLRDEAHRFGITYHRQLRGKRIISSELDKIKGIGEKRKELLLKKYKSVKKIKEQSIEELKKILPENIAIELKNTLKGD